MFETLGLENWTPRQAALVAGLVIGLLFGAFAQISRFCLRRGLTGARRERRAALGVWVLALGTALLGTQIAVATGWLQFTDHRFLSANLPIVALVGGGLLFGAGMMLTRGCISRLTVLSAGGNLRALTVIGVFAVSAHATLKGVLAPFRVWLGGPTFALGEGVALTTAPIGIAVAVALLAAAALLASRSGATLGTLAASAALGLLVPLAWFTTGVLLFDDFDPLPLESLSFTLPHAETLFFVIASTAIEAGFGVGLIGGALLGSLALHVARGQFRWQSFGTAGETARYLAGGTMMGIGGVLAGGCTVGAGLSGVSMLGASAIVALASIVLGGRLISGLLPENRAATRSSAIATPIATTA